MTLKLQCRQEVVMIFFSFNPLSVNAYCVQSRVPNVGIENCEITKHLQYPQVPFSLMEKVDEEMTESIK